MACRDQGEVTEESHRNLEAKSSIAALSILLLEA